MDPQQNIGDDPSQSLARDTITRRWDPNHNHIHYTRFVHSDGLTCAGLDSSWELDVIVLLTIALDGGTRSMADI